MLKFDVTITKLAPSGELVEEALAPSPIRCRSLKECLHKLSSILVDEVGVEKVLIERSET